MATLHVQASRFLTRQALAPVPPNRYTVCMRRFYLLALVVVGISAVAIFFWQRQRVLAALGPTVALCPGPDNYGYSCENGRAYSYIDATSDTDLHALDGLVTLDLPFPFTFYGTTYTQVQAISNGNLQFENGNLAFQNSCLTSGPAPTMGDMIAVYWTDTDMRFGGHLETELIGEAPTRIFVIEWDEVPIFGGSEADTLTFEVQLYEESNDIVLVYSNTTTSIGSHGENATIGIQSAAQGLALQYSCNQSAVTSGTSLQISHPESPNPAIGQTVLLPWRADRASAEIIPRAATAALLNQLNSLGPAALPRLKTGWLRQANPRLLDWRYVDLQGDARQELVVIWSDPANPARTELAVIELTTPPTLLINEFLAQPDNPLAGLEFSAVGDVSADGQSDMLLHDPAAGDHYLLTAHADQFALIPLPGSCQSPPTLADKNQDGQLDIVRLKCQTMTWNGRGFTLLP